jgi:monoamine oxidase
MHWNTASNYLGALVCTLPGQKPLFSYIMRQPEYNNRVFFAGEHVSTKHGWIQGALYSGKYAANQLAMYYGNNTSSE